MDPNTITAIGVAVGGLGAAAALASAVYGRTMAAANRGLTSATEQLVAANQELVRRTVDLVEESRLSREHWEAMALEAARARLDAKAPIADLELKPDLELSPRPGDSPRFARNFHTTTWRFPQDQDVRLVVCCQAVVTNHSQRALTARATGLLLAPSEGPKAGDKYVTHEEASLLPGGSYNFVVIANFTLGEWAEKADSRNPGESADLCAIHTITVFDDDDNGTVDEWEFENSGCPIVPAHGEQDGWKVRETFDPMTVFA